MRCVNSCRGPLFLQLSKLRSYHSTSCLSVVGDEQRASGSVWTDGPPEQVLLIFGLFLTDVLSPSRLFFKNIASSSYLILASLFYSLLLLFSSSSSSSSSHLPLALSPSSSFPSFPSLFALASLGVSAGVQARHQRLARGTGRLSVSLHLSLYLSISTCALFLLKPLSQLIK